MTQDQSPAPATIPELWYALEKRLTILEETGKLRNENHCVQHEKIDQDLKDHEQRIRTGLTLEGILTGVGGIISVIAIIRTIVQ